MLVVARVVRFAVVVALPPFDGVLNVVPGTGVIVLVFAML